MISKALAIADQMADEARALPALSTSAVMVYRQQEAIADDIARAVNIATGAAVVIIWTGFDREQDTEDILGPRVVSSYEMQLHYAPILTPGGTTIDVIAEALIRHFDHWNESLQPTNPDVYMRFRSCPPPESSGEGWLIYSLTFDKILQFPEDPSIPWPTNL